MSHSDLIGDEPSLPTGWEWHDTWPTRSDDSRAGAARYSMVAVPTDLRQGPRDVFVTLDSYEARDGSYNLTVRVSCSNRSQLLDTAAGILWALDTLVPATSNRATRRAETMMSWRRRIAAGVWRAIRQWVFD